MPFLKLTLHNSNCCKAFMHIFLNLEVQGYDITSLGCKPNVFFHAIIIIDVRKKAKIVRNCGRGFPENNKYTNTSLEGSTVNTFIQMCVFFCQTASFSKGQKTGGGREAEA